MWLRTRQTKASHRHIAFLYPIEYNRLMYTVFRSDVFNAWLAALKDIKARARILNRLDNVMRGTLGEYRTLGKDLHELKIRYGPGYRIYFVKKTDETTVFLLCGGDKSTQRADIARARAMMEE